MLRRALIDLDASWDFHEDALKAVLRIAPGSDALAWS